VSFSKVPVRIIPVIDIKLGVVVRGVGGRREDYQSVRSVLASDASPAGVAAGFVERLGLREIYVADLDAIAGAEPAWGIYKELLSLPVELWVDAGVAGNRRLEELAGFQASGRGLARLIAGLESLPELTLLGQFVEAVGPDRLVFSLDLMRGTPLCRVEALRNASPEKIAVEATACGVQTMIVLDLAYVGAGQGLGVSTVCQRIAALEPGLTLVAGGGVRSVDDIRELRQAGCRGVLIASALHDGKINAEDVRECSAL
jgi:phosphoribosylformimino-5-aminoimidazole carboxamide ribotide isomerase